MVATQATLADFDIQLEIAREDLEKTLAVRANTIVTQCGGYGNSRTILQLAEAVEETVELAAASMLGELRRFKERTPLPQDALRARTEAALRQFASKAPALARLDRARRGIKMALPQVDALEDRLSRHITRRMRQFDIGFDKPAKPEPTTVINALTAGTINGPVQQGGSHLIQNSEIEFNVDLARAAVDTIQIGLAQSNLDEATALALQGDLDTIKAQLRKPSPGVRVITEAGRSFRALTENIAAGALQPSVLVGLAALGQTLGF